MKLKWKCGWKATSVFHGKWKSADNHILLILSTLANQASGSRQDFNPDSGIYSDFSEGERLGLWAINAKMEQTQFKTVRVLNIAEIF